MVDEEADELPEARVVLVVPRRDVEVGVDVEVVVGHDRPVVPGERGAHPGVVPDPAGPEPAVVVTLQPPPDQGGAPAHVADGPDGVREASPGAGAVGAAHPVAVTPVPVAQTSVSCWPIRPTVGPAAVSPARGEASAAVAVAWAAGRLATAPHTEAATAIRVHAVATHHLCRLVMVGHHTTWAGVVVGLGGARPDLR